ncbi:MAG: glycosyltransferase family 2 protein [Verrucomicrobiota bacterium]
MMSVLFSIITPTYNCGTKIQDTLDSVLSQSFGDFEYLIVDGCSNDQSLEIFENITDERVRFISEPDLGIYDAMNKGVRMARGRYLIFLGAGDYLCPDVLNQIRQIANGGKYGLIYGNVYWHDIIYAGEFSAERLAFDNICHQAIFYRRDVFEVVGHFDLKYKLLADWEMNLRCFGDERIDVLYVPMVVSVYEIGGISGNPDLQFQRDKNWLVWRNLGSIVLLKYHLKSLRRRFRDWRAQSENKVLGS